MPKKSTRKLAALLSVSFPGLGQVYNRQLGKGLLFSAIAAALLVGYRSARLSTAESLGMLAFPYLGLWIYNIIDAWYGAKGTGKHAATRYRLPLTK